MDNLDYQPQDALFAMNHDYPTGNRNPPYPSMPSYLPPGWTLTSDVLEEEEERMRNESYTPLATEQTSQTYSYASTIPRRHNTPNDSPPTLQNPHGIGLGLAPGMNLTGNNLLQQAWNLNYQAAQMNAANYSHDAVSSISNGSYDDCSLHPGASLGSSPIDCAPMTAAGLHMPLHISTTGGAMPSYLSMAGPMESMGALAYPLNDQQAAMMGFSMGLGGLLGADAQGIADMSPSGAVAPGDSPSSSNFEISSLSSSDNGWTAISFAANSGHAHINSHSSTASQAIFNPSETLHIRSDSSSSSDRSASSSERLSGSYEDMPFLMHSPVDDNHSLEMAVGHGVPRIVTNMANSYATHEHHHTGYHHHDHLHQPVNYSSTNITPTGSPAAIIAISGFREGERAVEASPEKSPDCPSAPRRRRSPTNKTLSKITPTKVKKTDLSTAVARRTAAQMAAEKRVGRRKGPLRPEQRQQAHEIRKLRACLRCKFLKKTCDTGDICNGCRPSHARLWQVPCTRIDIKDIAYFIDDYESDFKRHVSVGMTVNNVKGFSNQERTVYITHGFGHYLPVNAREVYVIDDSCFEIDFVNTYEMVQYETHTSKLTTGIAGVSASKLNEYVDLHLDNGFDAFVDAYFDGTPFLTEILHTAYKYYQKTKTPVIRKALKLVLAYNLTVHITMVSGMSETEQSVGRIDEDGGRFAGKTIAPVMINFEVKCALAKLWRELQKGVLEELSGLYSSVYQGDKLRHWPTIFMVASILLAVWELMQFDCRYREPDESKVDKFCKEMEETPLGVIVGLFSAISQKLPSFMEWDTSKHAAALNNDEPICDALTEIREHVEKHEAFLRGRSDAKYCREDFDSLSSKFLSKLVIRAN